MLGRKSRQPGAAMICVQLASGDQSMFSLSLRNFFGFTPLPLLPKFNIGNLTPRLQGDRAAHTWSMRRKGAIILINRISNQEKTPPVGWPAGLELAWQFLGAGGERACQATLSSHDSNKRTFAHDARRLRRVSARASSPHPKAPTPARLVPPISSARRTCGSSPWRQGLRESARIPRPTSRDNKRGR